MKKMFESQGTPEQIQNTENDNLTEDQKRMSLERAATLEHGFQAGKEFMRNKKVLSEDEAGRIFSEAGLFDVDILTPSGATKKICGDIDDLSSLELGQLSIDGNKYSLGVITKIINSENGEVVWNNEDASFGD